jgi:hypothetical protein
MEGLHVFLFFVALSINLGWAFGIDETVEVHRVITLVLNVVYKLIKICWFQILGVMKGWWQIRRHDNKLLWCFGIFQKTLWGSWGFCGIWES